MDDLIKRFRDWNPKLHGRAWQTPEAKQLRDAAIAEAQRLVDRGHTPAQIARRFGVAPVTVQRWLSARAPLREVALVRAATVAPAAPASNPVVVLPSGVRIEGLSLDDIAALARALA